MDISASLGQCRPSNTLFEQVSMLSVRVACIVSSDGSPSIRTKTRSSELHRLEKTIHSAFGQSI